jgi:hypothetical protein
VREFEELKKSYGVLWAEKSELEKMLGEEGYGGGEGYKGGQEGRGGDGSEEEYDQEYVEDLQSKLEQGQSIIENLQGEVNDKNLFIQKMSENYPENLKEYIFS